MRASLHRVAALGLAMLLAACQAPVRLPPPESDPSAGKEPSPAIPVPSPVPEADGGDVDVAEIASATPSSRRHEPETISSDAIFSRLQAGLATRRCPATPELQRWQHLYARSPARFAGQIDASLPLLAYVLEGLERRELPSEFALIPIVESSYRPEAIGPGGASGMWQIMAATARGEGMVVRGTYDGRLSVLRATEVALDLLEAAYARFGDWRLAAMAYNAGEFGIARAVARNAPQTRADGRIVLPGASSGAHTYVAKLEALACLLREPARHGIALPSGRDVPRFTSIEIPPQVHRLQTIATALEMDTDRLAGLNAGFRHKSFVEGVPRRLLVPRETQRHWPRLDDLSDLPPAPSPQDASYMVRTGDSLWSIARRHGLRVKELMSWNRLGESAVLKPGQKLRLAP